MDERFHMLAEQLGAKVVAQVPDVGHGPLGAAHFGAFYRNKMAALRLGLAGQVPFRPPHPQGIRIPQPQLGGEPATAG